MKFRRSRSCASRRRACRIGSIRSRNWCERSRRGLACGDTCTVTANGCGVSGYRLTAGTKFRGVRDSGCVCLVLWVVLHKAIAAFHLAIEGNFGISVTETAGLLRLWKVREVGVIRRTQAIGLRSGEAWGSTRRSGCCICDYGSAGSDGRRSECCVC